ncbi:MAG: glycerol-3-phosphate acyltransferase [Coriobacteriia bacterium]|nr:glycerol-3-phosphate acyltransferase [Coriobacteriia bacterium]
MSAVNAGTLLLTALASYAIGSIPWAYTIVRAVTGEDVTAHGTGNVGAMNVRRTTGSWGWFAVAMVADALKGIIPVAIAKSLAFDSLATPVGILMQGSSPDAAALGLMPMAAVAGAVLGHNYSVWLAIKKRRFGRTGKGLATGGGALLSYDWRYCLAVVVVGLATIAVTRYMMAGQVAAAATLPAAALIARSPDWPFALAMGLVVYAAHHRRFVGLLRGQEPQLYIHDRSGPRG